MEREEDDVAKKQKLVVESHNRHITYIVVPSSRDERICYHAWPCNLPTSC